MSSQGARLFGLGYRSYEGPRRSPRWAIVSLGVFTVRRVLGLGRGARHKILPALVLLIAFAPAVVSVAVAAFLNDIESDQLISYGEYTFIIGSALALFAALIAPEALCPDRRSGCSACTSPDRSIATATSWARAAPSTSSCWG